MNTIKQTAIDRYNKTIADLERHRDAVDLLPDALVEISGSHLYSTDWHLRLDIPMTPTAFGEARQMLGRAWKRDKSQREYQDDDGDRYFCFVHKKTGVGLLLCLRVGVKGATCERRVVGTKEVPLYEVVCQ